MRAPICDQCVIKANTQFWEQMLAMSIDPVPPPAQFSASCGHFLASVQLSGVWNGSIQVRMAESLAYTATAAMILQPIDSVSQADAIDATGEIANMIAGTIKSCLPRPCAMTVPESVILDTEFRSQPPAADEMIVIFSHASGDMMVRVQELEFQQ